ncbi:hypothetical protein CCE28_20540 [Anaeromicrobium sediminis]|uniref:CAAX prenyl protease 2/Lysostaphin resistance protein A-like domain-containing protein n=2 Tax=Anaeromicrobium sediminis TaxID=1478221 RepID=A0A267MBB9_9FIRM|nr:hypothetical protein CCE28_20540 [Anaeromicrobium sediminis]
METILSFFILLNYLKNENMGVNLKIFFYYDKKIIHYLFPLTIIIGSSFIIIVRIENLVLTFIPMKEEIKVLFENLFGGNISLLGSLIGGVLVASIVEECLFRGIILNGFLKKYDPPKAIFYSTGIFTLFHLNPWQLIAPFTLGIILSICFYKTKSLYVCVYGHSLYNLISILYVRINKNHSFGKIVNIPLWIYLLAILLFLIGVIIGNRVLKGKI